MGLFDSLRNQARDAVRDAVQGVGNKTETIVFPTVPDRYEEFTALPQAAMATPFETAAMTVIALCVYPRDPETSVRMLNFLRGPRPLNGQELSFIRDRFRAKDYVPRSYLPSCSSPPGARTIPGPSSCGRPRTGSGICGSRPFSPISGSRKAPTPGPKSQTGKTSHQDFPQRFKQAQGGNITKSPRLCTGPYRAGLGSNKKEC